MKPSALPLASSIASSIGPLEIFFVLFIVAFYAVPMYFVGKTAERKGLSVIGYVIFAAFLWPVALVVVLVARDRSGDGTVTSSGQSAASAPLAPDAPAAGWYPNPNGQGQRYWDGRVWTDHFSPPESPSASG